MKFRYLCRKFPTLEWSGILFYTHTGSFENNDLVITCEDFYPMDLGTPAYTEYKVSEDIVGYIADNIELFSCEQGLCHSHNQMKCWFSGTDINTLRSEGNDTNCFVSLIVNNAGEYCAAITRKVKTTTQTNVINYSSSYEFFGEGSITSDETKELEGEVIEKEVIEYFMLDVEREAVDNPLDYLDRRFDEIEAQKKKAIPTVITPTPDGNRSPWLPQKGEIINPASKFGNNFDEDYSFRDWQKSQKKTSAEAKESLLGTEQSLFPEEVMEEMTDISKWEPDPTIIHHLVCQIITCSLIVNQDIDLKQWITRHMERKYAEIFGPHDIASPQFDEWKEFIVEFMIHQYEESNIPDEVYEDYDQYLSKIASAMHNELYQYPENPYIEEYKEVLTRYIYE